MEQSTDIRDTFFQECEELLEALNDGLNQIQDGLSYGATDSETLNAVFRSVHSIKGGAGAFGLEPLVRFAHRFETALDAVRSGRLDFDLDLMQIFHRAADHLSDLVAASRSGGPIDASAGADISDRLVLALGEGQSATEEVTVESLGFTPMAISFDLDLPSVDPSENGAHVIRFRPHRGLYANGNDPAILFRLLGELGQLSAVADVTAIVPLGKLDWQESYLSWTIKLSTDETEDAIHDVFEFVEGLCELDVGTDLDSDQFEALSETTVQDEYLKGTIGIPQIAGKGLTPMSQGDDDRSQKQSSSARATVRVELDRVDRLINVVGELVINQAMLSQCVHEAGISPRSDIGTGLDEFRNLAREIQESVMAIRAQPIKPLFQRMSRIVREASDISGKQVNFQTEGDMTEVDKTVIERLADPLTHMIRNAVDHGIESTAKRRTAGKSEIGVITLSAAHRSGRVLIDVSDDGAGINRDRVKEIAISKGLIPDDADLSDAEIDKLLFLPGFSTAGKISDLSGRGVGMDVVKSAIQALGGRVIIQSTPGKGTTFSISLPLTLAVLDGMVVDVAGQTMVVPITAIVETLRPPPKDIHTLADSGQVVAIRGNFVPIIDLGALFGHRMPIREFTNCVLLLVETDQNGRCALAVDAIYDQRQVVIKGLENNYGHVPGVAAATILGDGKIALIIDPEETVLRAVVDEGSLEFIRAAEVI